MAVNRLLGNVSLIGIGGKCNYYFYNIKAFSNFLLIDRSISALDECMKVINYKMVCLSVKAPQADTNCISHIRVSTAHKKKNA